MAPGWQADSEASAQGGGLLRGFEKAGHAGRGWVLGPALWALSPLVHGLWGKVEQHGVACWPEALRWTCKLQEGAGTARGTRW